MKVDAFILKVKLTQANNVSLWPLFKCVTYIKMHLLSKRFSKKKKTKLSHLTFSDHLLKTKLKRNF